MPSNKVLRLCPGVGEQKCGYFMSAIERDPHPTCQRCRGKICYRNLTCDICKDWSEEQWREFEKKKKKKKKKSKSLGPTSPTVAPSTNPDYGNLTVDEYWHADRFVSEYSDVTRSEPNRRPRSLTESGSVGTGLVGTGSHLLPLAVRGLPVSFPRLMPVPSPRNLET